MVAPAITLDTAHSVESVIARLERLPISRELTVARIVIGSATFFDAYTVLAIAYAMPVLAREWSLTPGQIGTIISAGYVGQIFGALFFGWLAERIGRLNVLLITVIIFTSTDLACLFAWSGPSMMAFRFFQGIGTGGEVPVASAYMNEFVSAKRRGRFFLLYEVLFLFGLLAAGLIGYFLVPIYGWRAMFVVGLVPSILAIPCAGSWWSHHVGCCLLAVSSRRPIWSAELKIIFRGAAFRWSRQQPRSIPSTKRDRTYASFSKDSISAARSCSPHYGCAHT
jgi:MFS family permease